MNIAFPLQDPVQSSPVVDFATFFKLKFNTQSGISFRAVINCFGVAGAQKMDAKVHISSEKLPMDTICIEAELAEVAGLPPKLKQENNIFSYLPGQFLMIDGQAEQYGQYNILVYPKMMEVVVE